MQRRDFRHPVMDWCMFDDRPMDAVFPGYTHEKFLDVYSSLELWLAAPEGMPDGIYDFTVDDFTPDDFTPDDFTPDDFTPDDFTPDDSSSGAGDTIFHGLVTGDSHPVFHGIVVMGGKFDPHMSAHAVYLAQAARFGTKRIDSVHIERIDWEQPSFRVTVGI